MTDLFRKEIVQRITRNLLDIQMLRLIHTQPMWGYGIKKRIEEMVGVQLRHGALYPLLNTLEQKGFLTSKEDRKEGRIRKVYTITRKGIQYLDTYRSVLKEQVQNSDLE